jgi:hypothetical protein
MGNVPSIMVPITYFTKAKSTMVDAKKIYSQAHNKIPQTSQTTKMSHHHLTLSSNGIYCHGNIRHGPNF